MKTILVHGVPDTPQMWQPLIEALAEDGHTNLSAPALPGFTSTPPSGFDCSKEAYVSWLISEIEGAGDPVNLVGHDWGALLVVRAASLRPDMVSSWAVANALPERDYEWHQTARIWQTPVLGELFMALTGKDRLARSLEAAGMPQALARHEADHWSPHMRKSILRLYRSAKNIAEEWTPDLDKLPERGLVFWGDDDPFVPVETAQRFCATTGIPLHRNANTGHWSVVEKAAAFAKLLKAHWKD
ncbi:alpha/beta hydrolase [Henriciella barbarensis]|uniref:Alpha/beta hydrolase n=1 Tax=Henriciella barbarensis TaxID=86342 RepID=A0A399R6E5_9PROT|nr:alpha/beta hydrolase [Henriciella barbarensis]RIJ26343.1 alpha/beta hydrolase [Henriciella barbarensis]